MTVNSSKLTLAQMPPGYFPLFFIQLFTTMSFAVMYSTLVLYMKQKLGLSSQTADIITGVYFAYNFALHLLGGSIGGRFFSYRSLVAIGAVFQLIGCLFLARVNLASLYMGLTLVLIGTGTMTTCLNMLVSQLFAPTDMRRETAFFWNYSSMNIGFVLGFTLAGFFQLNSNYRMLFSCTALTNIVGLAILFFYWKVLGDRDTVLSHLNRSQKIRSYSIGVLIIAVLIPSLYVLLHHTAISDNLILAVGAIMVITLFLLAFRYETKQRNKIFAFIIVLLFAQIFWVIYQVAPMGLTLFAQYNVDRHLLGILIAPAWIQNINSLTIIICGPLLAILFKWLRHKNYDVSVPLQFSTGLFLAAISLFLLPIGILYASPQGFSPFVWLFWCYILQALAELCISPIGYSMVGLLAPPKLQSVMMGMVLLNAGVAAVLASYFSNYAMGQTTATSPLITNLNFSHAFNQLGITTLVFTIALVALIPFIMKLIGQGAQPKIGR